MIATDLFNNKTLLRYIFIIIYALIIYFIIFMIYSFYSFKPLDKNRICDAVLDNYKEWNISIRRICLQKGGYAGNIGFYFIELDPCGYIIVPDDERLYPWYEKNKNQDINLVEYYRRAIEGGWNGSGLPHFDNTNLINVKDLTKIFSLALNENEIFWSKYK